MERKNTLAILKKHCDCTLTGVCFDNDILEPIVNFMVKPDNHTIFEELIDTCLDNIMKAVQNEVSYWNSKECILEEIKANEYEFLENGEIY